MFVWKSLTAHQRRGSQEHSRGNKRRETAPQYQRKSIGNKDLIYENSVFVRLSSEPTYCPTQTTLHRYSKELQENPVEFDHRSL